MGTSAPVKRTTEETRTAPHIIPLREPAKEKPVKTPAQPREPVPA